MKDHHLLQARVWGQFGILVCLACVAYGNSFPGAFHFDDFPLMLENPRVTGRSFDYGLFLNQYGARPLTLWTFHLNHRWGGADPAAFHAVSVFLHLLVGVLLYLVATSFGFSRKVALPGAAVFLVHPLQSQAVNYVWSRSVLLMSVFILLALWIIRKRPAAGLVAFQLAVWSRAEALIVVPLLVLLLERRWRWIPLVLAAVNLLGLYRGVAQEQPAEFGLAYADAAGYWWAQPWALLRYLSLMVWPTGLSIDHGTGEVGRVVVLAPAVAFLAACLIVCFLDPKRRARLGGLLAVSMLLLLPSALVANPDLVNESRSYPALAGVSLVAGMALGRVGGPWLLRVAAAGLVLVPLLAATRTRNEIWQRDVDLWADAVGKAPGKSRTHYNLGSALAREGRTDRARRSFLRASRLNPFDDLSYAGLGYCAELEGLTGTARRYYRRAVELAPENAYAQEGAARMELAGGAGSR